MAPIGKRIRDVERALKRCVPEKEDGLRQTLAALQLEKKANETKLREKNNSQKYHLVKFVERQKLCRRVHKVDKALQSVKSKSEKKVLTKQREYLVDDLTYVMYYPMSMKYIALFANADEEEDEQTAKLKLIAREKALEARRVAIENGDEDRVQRAIDVEMGAVVVTKPAGGSKKRPTSTSGQEDKIRDVDDCEDTGVLPDLSEQPLKKKKKVMKKVSVVVVGDAMTAVEERSSIPKDSFFADEASDTEEAGMENSREPYGQSWKRAERAGNNLRLARGDLVRKIPSSQWKAKAGERELTKQELRLQRWKEKKRTNDGRGVFNDDRQQHGNPFKQSYKSQSTQHGSSSGNFNNKKRDDSQEYNKSHSFRQSNSSRDNAKQRTPRGALTSTSEHTLGYGGVSAANTSEIARMKGTGAIGKSGNNKKIVFNNDV